ncbi:hypothetical protein [Methylocystis sp. JR02]|uniref:hypothetical protein n=1 Tax=Methylocystis sp. JR02 TaxID=3046284 RepID=UPI0024BAD8DC|nr:hypothetical protein [Methylocystis sp. JR02]MDJ0449330.1 hypothetical protein [Methylocystis sp. JR02]
MTQQADDKELMAAFAEFKQLLQRESEPVGASAAPAVSLAPEANAATPEGAALEAPRLFAADAPIARPLANHFAPPPIAPALSGSEGWSVASSGEGEATVAEHAGSGGRRKLVYVSLAVIAIGVASLGWTLTKWRPAEDPVADLSLPAEPEALAPGASEAALEPPAAEPAKDLTPVIETPTTDKAELTPPQAAEAPAHGQLQPATAPAPEAAATALPEPAAPAPAPAPRRVEAVSAPPAAPEAVAPVAAAAAGAALSSTGAGAARLTPPSAPRTAALPPANRFTPPEPAAPAAQPAPKPPAPAKIAKPKAAPAAAAAKHAKPRPAPAERAPVASAAPVAAAAPEPAPPPPAPPQSEGGPLGFMKRTLNSVGSTISGVTRSVIP